MNLSNKKCVACEGGVSPLTAAEAHGLLQHLQGWDDPATSPDRLKQSLQRALALGAKS